MSRIELIFGGILALAVIAAGSFVVFQNGLPIAMFQSAAQDERPSYGAAAMSAPDGREAAVFTGNRETDLCTCYETGFQRGAENRSIQSVAYRGGYSSCRGELGTEGGEAWTEGWANGAENRLAQRSCRLYLKRIEIQ